MFHKDYSNFVRPSNDEISERSITLPKISGEEAKKLYLEEIKNAKNRYDLSNRAAKNVESKSVNNRRKVILTDRELFQCVQNNDSEVVSNTLDTYPDKINIVDEFGWSLLMIACQANSIEIVKELLKRGIDTSVRDKAGNSAQSLVIKNKNYILANILLSHKTISNVDTSNSQKVFNKSKQKHKEEYCCEICGDITYPDKEEHLSSTVHNINASKGKKIPTNYVIPASNRGYQLMLKKGWDRETGLGPTGTGTKYPIKTIQKKDRKGLGQKPKCEISIKESPKTINKKVLAREKSYDRKKEINFRREFY